MLLNPGNHKLILALLIGVLTSIHAANAQEYSYVHYDVKDGLAGSLVYCGVQDHDGFLWFGTETGLSRFDGTHFQNFSAADGLPDNEIIRLFVDSKNRVWIMPFRNSICYYYKGKIYNQQNDSTLAKIKPATEIIGMAESKNGELLFMVKSSIYLLDSSQNVLRPKYDVPSMFYSGVGTNDEGLLTFVGNDWRHNPAGHIAIFEIVNRRPAIKKEYYSPNDFTHIGLESVLIMPSLNAYVNARWDSIIIADNNFEKKFSVPMPQEFVGMNKLNGNLFAVNARSASYVYDLGVRKKVNEFKRDKLNNVIQDNENNIWFLTDGSGVFKLGSSEIINKEFIHDNRRLPVYCLHKQGTALYIGTENYHIWKIDSVAPAFFSHTIRHLESGGRVIAMANLPNGKILVGTDREVVSLDNSSEHRMMIENLKIFVDTFRLAVKSLNVFGDTLLFSSDHNVLQAKIRDTLSFDTLWISRSTCSYKKDNIYYIGTLNGLYSLNAKKEASFLGEKIPAFQDRVNAIKESSDGTLWISTNGHGIIGYKDGLVKYSVTEKEGLTSDICKSLFINSNEVWVGTEKGLNRVRCSNGNCQVLQITDADGLPSNTINAIYVEGNMIYIGTPLGMTYFDITKISSSSQCLLRITSIRTSNNNWTSDTSGFRLAHNNNSIQFDFVGISFRSGGDINYRYRLLGADTAWQNTRQNSLNFPALPSGNYELQLVATNKFGVKSKMATIAFMIAPRMWERTWFRLAAAIIFLLILWIIVNARIRFIRKQEDTKLETTKRINELEQKALKAQMNPHFIFNSLNSIQQYVIDKNISGANKFITEFARLIRLTLELSSQPEVRLEDEINYLSTYLELEKTKLEELFQYQLTVRDSVSVSNWLVPPMILQPFVENAIRHGVRYRKDKKGMIMISFEKNGNNLICTINDNGVGREQSKLMKAQLNISIEYQSRGMMLTAKRVEMINRYSTSPISIELEDGDTQEVDYPGTKVKVILPVKEIHSSNY